METKLKQEPVADGGGLQEWESLKAAAEWSIRNNRGNWMRVDSEFDGYASPENILKLLAAYASSQEALRLARERMQQAVAELEPCVSHYLNQPVRTGITKAISLLSPEGSSR